MLVLRLITTCWCQGGRGARACARRRLEELAHVRQLWLLSSQSYMPPGPRLAARRPETARGMEARIGLEADPYTKFIDQFGQESAAGRGQMD